MVQLSVIVQFVIVFLVPIIPAAFLFYKIPVKNVQTTIEGAFYGLSVKAGGAAALYCLLTLLAGFVFNSVIGQGKRLVDGSVTITVVGADEDVQRFFATIGGRIAIQFVKDNQVLASARGFLPDPYKNIINSENFTFESGTEGPTVSVVFTPQRRNLKLAQASATMNRSMAMTLTVSPLTGGDFISPIDIEQVHFSKGGAGIAIRHAIVLDNITEGSLSTILFTPSEVENISKARFSLKRITKRERDTLVAEWSRDSTSDQDAGIVASRITEQLSKITNIGTIIDSDVLSQDEILQLQKQTFRDPGKVARFMAGITPRIDLGSRPIRSGESVLVEIEIERDGLPPGRFKFAPDAERIGRRYLYTTQRAVFSVTSDDTLMLSDLLGDVQFQSADGNTDRFGDLRSKRSTASRTIVLDFEGIQRNSFFLLPVYWSEPKR